MDQLLISLSSQTESLVIGTGSIAIPGPLGFFRRRCMQWKGGSSCSTADDSELNWFELVQEWSTALLPLVASNRYTAHDVGFLSYPLHCGAGNVTIGVHPTRIIVMSVIIKKSEQSGVGIPLILPISKQPFSLVILIKLIFNRSSLMA